jgi:hypothetical protein
MSQEPPYNILQPLYELVDNRQNMAAMKQLNSGLQKYKNSKILRVKN